MNLKRSLKVLSFIVSAAMLIGFSSMTKSVADSWPIYIATELGIGRHASPEEFSRFLDRHPEWITETGNTGHFLLHYAADNDLVDIADLLIRRGAMVNRKNEYGDTPLHSALNHCSYKVADLLLENGADATCRNNRGVTPLHLTTKFFSVSPIVHKLMAQNIDVNCKDNLGFTPLHWCVRHYSMGLADFLITSGADINCPNNSGDTPLHDAVKPHGLDFVQFLIEHGADVTRRNNDGFTALHWAVERDVDSDIIRLLLTDGDPFTVDVSRLDWRDSEGNTPLHLAARRGLVEKARLLLQYGAKTTCRNKDGKTPLDCAVDGGYTRTANVLKGDSSGQGRCTIM